MTAPSTLTSDRIRVAPQPGFVGPDGAIGHDHWPAYIRQLREAGWTVRQIGDRLAGGGKAGERAVYRWLDGTRVASRAVRRLAHEALMAPLVAEVMLALQPPPAPSQAAPRQPAPKALPPAIAQPDVEAFAKEAGVDIQTAEAWIAAHMGKA